MTSIFWLNYNSSSFMDVALESLEGVLDLDYSNYELVVVDNCSTDKSFNVIRDFIVKRMSAIDVKVIRLPRNLGFNGGNNAAYKARYHGSKYVVLLNNDAIPYPNSLKTLIEFMESDNSLGGLEGIYLNYDGKTIAGAGNFMSELLSTYSMNSILPRPHYITYACGTYSVHRVSSIRKAVGRDDSIFDDCMFAYYDDDVLGLKMWNTNSKIATFPVIAARHKGSSSFGRIRPFQAYLEARGLATLNEISNSRYKELIKPLFIYSAYTRTMLESRVFGPKQNMRDLARACVKGFGDGVRIGREKRRLGETIDIYKAPIVRLSLPIIIDLIPAIRLSGRVMTKLNQTVFNGLYENTKRSMSDISQFPSLQLHRSLANSRVLGTS